VTTPLRSHPLELLTVKSMSEAHDLLNAEYDRVDRYYTGDQPLRYMSSMVRSELALRIGAPIIVNWPEVVVDSVARRLNVEGFRLGQGGEADDELWRIWTANQMDEESPLAHVDALVHGVAYLLVWGNDLDPETPTITLESAHQMTVDYAPGGKTVRSALKRWTDGGYHYATLYLPDRVCRFSAEVRDREVYTVPVYTQFDEVPNPVGAVPVVPMVNRGRAGNRSGRSELRSIIPLADGINRLVGDMMETSHYYVTPRRYVEGVDVPAGADRERFQAEMKAFWEDAPKSKFLVAGAGSKFGQFPEANLSSFVEAINLLTSKLAAIGGLPPDDLGLNQVNPASAEARRAAETTLVNRVKEKWRPYGGAYTRAMRLAIAFRDGVPLSAIAPEFDRMQTAWQDPATPAIAQAMDAAQKGVEAGIYDTEAAQQAVGLSPVERAAIKARAAESAAMAATATVRAQMDLADELQRRGLTQNAALAAAGLLQAAALNSAEQAAPPQ
jgi:hypothetical protein